MPWSVTSVYGKYDYYFGTFNCGLYYHRCTLRSFHMSIIHVLQSSKYGAWNIPPRLNRDVRSVWTVVRWNIPSDEARSSTIWQKPVQQHPADRGGRRHTGGTIISRVRRLFAIREGYVSGARQLSGNSRSRRSQLVSSATSLARSCREFRREYSSGRLAERNVRTFVRRW